MNEEATVLKSVYESSKSKHEGALDTLKSEHNTLTDNYENELRKSREERLVLKNDITSLNNKLFG